MSNFNKSEMKKQLIKNTVRQNECEITDLASVFFSEDNIKIINRQLVLSVYKLRKFKIPFQDTEDLLVVMRYVFGEHARNLPFKIKQQIRQLNKIVVKSILPEVISQVEQDIAYLEDINTIKINELPKNTRLTRGSTELPPMF
jgi:hypothetical protein